MSLDEVDFDDEILDDVVEPVVPLRRGRDPIEVPIKIRAVGMRLDQYLAMAFTDFSRTALQDAIKAETVRINGLPTKASYKVRPGDMVRIELPELTHDLPHPEDIPLDILYEDEVLALINKPANMVVHPAKGNWNGTLVNALQFHFKELSLANGNYRAGIVHRLDRDTSGVILVAKEEQTHRELGLSFEQRHVFKEYIALTYNTPDRDSDYIELRIRHHPTDRIKMVATADATDPEAKDACSYYEVLERFRGFALVKIQPRTGRTHQIRVHLGSIGCPVIADKVYSGRDRFMLSDVLPTTVLTNNETLIERQALHAHRLRFLHPRKQVWMEFVAPFPADMQRALNSLREHRTHTQM